MKILAKYDVCVAQQADVCRGQALHTIEHTIEIMD